MRGLFHKTHPKRRKPVPVQGCAAIDPKGRRLLGLTLDGRPIWAPEGHSLLLAANGAGKTSCGCLPWLLSLVAAPDRPALLVIDPKNGEMAAPRPQAARRAVGQNKTAWRLIRWGLSPMPLTTPPLM